MSDVTLSDEQWTKIYTYLKQQSGIYTGRESDCRTFVSGVLWILRSGSQWRTLPASYGNWNAVYKRFSRWEKKGVWQGMRDYFAADAQMENVVPITTLPRIQTTVVAASLKAEGN